ncbi:MAG: hypothetical protein ACXVCP_00470 [Bdellovibrio sp.]
MKNKPTIYLILKAGRMIKALETSDADYEVVYEIQKDGTVFLWEIRAYNQAEDDFLPVQMNYMYDFKGSRVDAMIEAIQEDYESKFSKENRKEIA